MKKFNLFLAFLLTGVPRQSKSVPLGLKYRFLSASL